MGGGAPVQQGEIRLNANPYQYPMSGDGEKEEGDFVPEIFRQNHHKSVINRPTSGVPQIDNVQSITNWYQGIRERAGSQPVSELGSDELS